ncbi:FAD-dependent oxidoreductase [Nonomuraea sp. SBT364]|uniref:FAD-dependent oxidoreductase n=1 Tax=Nonomuraea sp. SBT364 TaxID=1580530 RepID=UPI003FA5B2A1
MAAIAGLEVTPNGQIIVDDTMRSVSHPNIYAAGDSAHAIGDNGRLHRPEGHRGNRGPPDRPQDRELQAGLHVQPHQSRAAGRHPAAGRRRRASEAEVPGRLEARADQRRASSRWPCGPPRT